MLGTRRSRFRKYRRAEQRRRRAFCPQPFGTEVLWAQFGVASPRYTPGLASCSRLELRPKHLRRMRESKSDRLLGLAVLLRWLLDPEPAHPDRRRGQAGRLQRAGGLVAFAGYAQLNRSP